MMGHLNPHHSVNWFVCLRVLRFNGNSLKLSLTSSSPGGGNCLSLPRSFFLHPRGVFWVISVNKSWVVLNSKPHCVDKGRILFEFNKIPDFQSDNQLGSFFIPCVSSKKQRVEKVKCDSFLFGQTITYLSCVFAKASETLTGRGFVSEASLRPRQGFKATLFLECSFTQLGANCLLLHFLCVPLGVRLESWTQSKQNSREK